MGSDFLCLHTPDTLFKSRLYVHLETSKKRTRNIIFSEGYEKKGLGMTEYAKLLGLLLTFIGIAFKTKDEYGHTLYINKKSFCKLIKRINDNKQKYGNSFNINFVNSEYYMQYNEAEQLNVEKIQRTFNAILPSLSDKNILEVSLEMFKRV